MSRRTALVISNSKKADKIQKLLGDADVFSYGTARDLGSGRRYRTIILNWPNSDFFAMVMSEEEFIGEIVTNLSALLEPGGELIYV